MSNGFRDLVVWQKSIDLVTKIYQFTETFPAQELYGLANQMRRSAVSIPSNIAEGSKRSTPKDFRHFLSIAFGSVAELETQVEIAKNLHLGEVAQRMKIEAIISEVSKMLYVLTHPKDS